VSPVPATIWTDHARRSDALEVHLLGTVDFDAVQFLQERLVYELSGREDRMGGVLVCEHPPLVTIGREGSRADLPPDLHDLAVRGMDVRWVNRGGGVVVHAPGQLAVYPVLPLDRLGVGLAEYRRRLEETIIDTCRELRIPAERDADRAGVFTAEGQVAFVGAAVRSWVAHQGFFVNVAPDMALERMAGLRDTTSLLAQRRRRVRTTAVRESLVRNLASRFAYSQHHIYTGHPLLKRTRRPIPVTKVNAE
jgi:lipoyl(octanoyl) transferase